MAKTALAEKIKIQTERNNWCLSKLSSQVRHLKKNPLKKIIMKIEHKKTHKSGSGAAKEKSRLGISPERQHRFCVWNLSV